MPVFPTVKYWGVNAGFPTPPLLANERVSEPLPYGAAVFSVATAPQVPLEAVWDAEVVFAVAAASAGVDVHTNRTAAAMAAAALLE